ncbi:MAG: hypothetical protein K9K67_13360 [Bacteriovoracaceae bacterium]|nr:hypothetical protein [Bacteriovoracaceae bacterium]
MRKIFLFLIFITSVNAQLENYPRVKIEYFGTNYISLWDESDSLMKDSDFNGILDINDRITEEYIKRTNQTGSAIVINAFSAVYGDLDNGYSYHGILLIPFVNSIGQAECPTHDLVSRTNNVLYNIIMESIGLDTQAVYLAKSRKDDRYIYAAYSQIKNRRFHLVYGRRFPVSDSSVAKYPVFFTLPFNDEIYEIKSPGHHLPGGAVAPPDKRIGCTPVLNI